MKLESVCGYVLALIAAPILLGVINRVKAFFAGRRGPPVLQAYHDLFKLLRKSAVYSGATGYVFKAGPLVGLAAVMLALTFMPFGGIGSIFSFNGDFLLVAYLLGVMRFGTVLAALDTGSSFEGMGASREVQFAALAEPALLLGMAVIIRMTGQLALADGLQSFSFGLTAASSPIIILLLMAWFIVFLVENARIPFDDPNTHLELTMIHEVMALDHGGPDLAFILYGAALKMWLIGALLVNLLIPAHTGNPLLDLGMFGAGMLLLAAAVGIIESTKARLRLLRAPQLLIAACAFSILALVLVLR
ncbi:MAG: NADH-quinone oxidoreductase subunit H [Kiritimatiellae bacterium]|jgi:formate hydrogenlyase subunit 4|nr:NADH-quinone oxidoreductase subunit H [Kiritimatiellia bacterium]